MSTILVLAPYVPHPPTHGGSIRSRVLLEALAQDHAVHLAAPIASATERTQAAMLAEELDLVVHALPARPAARARLGSKLRCWLRGRSELLQRRWAPAAPGRVRELLGERQFTMVVADSSFVLPILPAVAAPLLLHLHNIESAVFARDDGVPRGAGERWTRLVESRRIAAAERAAIRRAAATITVAERDRELALAMAPGSNVVAVPNSVDLDRLPLLPPPPAGPPRLLFVGSLDYPPNLQAATELVDLHLPALRAAFPDLCVRLVGRDDGGHGVRFRGREGVEAVGPVDDLLPHYRCSHAVYLPIRNGGGTRIKILEAWALGRPVIATAVGAEGLGARDGEHFRCFATVAQGTAAVRAVLADGAASLIRNGRALVEADCSHAAARLRLRAAAAAALTAR